jgi:tRNA (guanosine-2'-O-)-methyltransferase
MSENLINYLTSFLTDSRLEGFRRVLNDRTRYLTVVLEDIYQSQNASAILRTCDCFGIQDVHIIENTNKFQVNVNVVRGATQWLNLYHYHSGANNTLDAIHALKDKGYRIIATSPHKNDIDLHHFDLELGKTALVFGTERRGISSEVIENADGFLKIPMLGFTESLNVSVSAAIILHWLTTQLQTKNIDWRLNDAEKQDVILQWLRSTLKHVHLLEQEYFRNNPM